MKIKEKLNNRMMNKIDKDDYGFEYSVNTIVKKQFHITPSQFRKEIKENYPNGWGEGKGCNDITKYLTPKMWKDICDGCDWDWDIDVSSMDNFEDFIIDKMLSMYVIRVIQWNYCYDEKLGEYTLNRKKDWKSDKEKV